MTTRSLKKPIKIHLHKLLIATGYLAGCSQLPRGRGNATLMIIQTLAFGVTLFGLKIG